MLNWDIVTHAFWDEMTKQANALAGAAGYAPMSARDIPNQIARQNKLPKLPTLNTGGLNANTALGSKGGGIGGGGLPPGSTGYGVGSPSIKA